MQKTLIVARELETQADAAESYTYHLTHRHGHGDEFYTFTSNDADMATELWEDEPHCPKVQKVIKALNIDFEPHKSEIIRVVPAITSPLKHIEI